MSYIQINLKGFYQLIHSALDRMEPGHWYILFCYFSKLSLILMWYYNP